MKLQVNTMITLLLSNGVSAFAKVPSRMMLPRVLSTVAAAAASSTSTSTTCSSAVTQEAQSFINEINTEYEGLHKSFEMVS